MADISLVSRVRASRKMAISRQKPRVPVELPYLLIELFFTGMPVAGTDARAGGHMMT